jgi:glucan-binding YG repeat protein
MVYAKRILSGLAAFFLAQSWFLFRGMSGEKATGLAAVAGDW